MTPSKTSQVSVPFGAKYSAEIIDSAFRFSREVDQIIDSKSTFISGNREPWRTSIQTLTSIQFTSCSENSFPNKIVA